MPSAPTGTQEARWGYFDDQNGAYFGQDSTGIFVAIRRNGSETFRVYQSNWNADSLDGTGPSGLTLDTSRGNIYHILYTCYGYGVTNFWIVVTDSNNVQQIVTVHRFKPERRITSERKTGISIDGTISPTVSFRRKMDFPAAGRPNSVSVKLEGIDIISDTDAIFEIRYNPSLTDATWGTPTNTSSSETAVESDTSVTDLTGGELIFSGLVGGGAVFSTSFITANLLELDFNGTQPVTVAIKTISGSGTASVVFRIREEW